VKQGVASRTAIWVSVWRGLSRFDARPIVVDELADRLAPMPYRPILDVARALPRASRAVLTALDVASGGRVQHMALRTRAIDDALEEAVTLGARQIVLLGAGLDARAWRMNALREASVYEVDHPSTQVYKKERIGELAPRAARVAFVDVDFERQDLGARLEEAGFDPREKSAWVWEGVSMYLTGAAHDATLSAVARASAAGSRVFMTYHSGQHIAPLAFAVKVVREPFVSTFSPDEIRALLARNGFRVTRDESDPEWGARYLEKSFDFAVERLVWAEREKD
jgi:methyltransferase (TIGR00027 family)